MSPSGPDSAAKVAGGAAADASDNITPGNPVVSAGVGAGDSGVGHAGSVKRLAVSTKEASSRTISSLSGGATAHRALALRSRPCRIQAKQWSDASPDLPTLHWPTGAVSEAQPGS